MKIVINTDQIYLHGGIEKVLSIKANYWAKLENVEIIYVTTEQKNQLSCYPLDDRIQIIDLGVNYNRDKSYFSTENILKAIKHYLLQKKLFKKIKPNVIISPNFNFDHFWLPFIKNNAKLLKELHGSRFYENEARKVSSFFGKIKFKINDWIYSKYDNVIVLNDDEKEFIYSSNAVVIPNPIEPQTIRAQLYNTKVIAAGRISPVKGFDHLIKAWSIVNKTFPLWELHIYGKDYLKTEEKLKQLIFDHRLENVVHFMGSIDNITEKMAEYSLYAMTSQTECFPMVLLEALSVGLPVVSYNCPTGPRNIVKDKIDSLLVSNQDINIFADSLMMLMDNLAERKKMGNSAKKNYIRFTTAEVMKKWQSLLNLSDV